MGALHKILDRVRIWGSESPAVACNPQKCGVLLSRDAWGMTQNVYKAMRADETSYQTQRAQRPSTYDVGKIRAGCLVSTICGMCVRSFVNWSCRICTELNVLRLHSCTVDITSQHSDTLAMWCAVEVMSSFVIFAVLVLRLCCRHPYKVFIDINRQCGSPLSQLNAQYMQYTP